NQEMRSSRNGADSAELGGQERSKSGNALKPERRKVADVPGLQSVANQEMRSSRNGDVQQVAQADGRGKAGNALKPEREGGALGREGGAGERERRTQAGTDEATRAQS